MGGKADSGYSSPYSTPTRTCRGTMKTVEAADQAAWNSVDVFHNLLLLNRGTTLLELKERITVFQLFQWNGDIQKAKAEGLSRDAVLQLSLFARLDDQLRSQMAVKWARMEVEDRGRITRELQIVKRELDRLRASGRELRFSKEKKDILLEAFAIYQRQQQRKAASQGSRSFFSGQSASMAGLDNDTRSRCSRGGFSDMTVSQISSRRTIASRF